MKCYSPQRVIITPRGKDGKRVVKFIGNTDSQYVGNGEIPCGKCIGCRLAYSSEWGVRCYLESTLHKHNHFVTLTYDDDNLPYELRADEDGLPIKVGNLVHKDLTLFFKKLRFDYESKDDHIGIRYFACGEYGDHTSRPHFHIVFFNLPLDDLMIYKKNFDGSIYYNSDRLSKIWGKGHVVIAPVTFESAAYVARYVMKKQIGNPGKSYVEFNKLNKEFVTMSRRPGIARNYFDSNYKTIYRDDEVLVPTNKGVRSFKPPSYFDRLYTDINPDHMYKIMDDRKEFVEDMLKNISHDQVLQENARADYLKNKKVAFVRDIDTDV